MRWPGTPAPSIWRVRRPPSRASTTRRIGGTQGNNPTTSSGPAGSGQPWTAAGACAPARSRRRRPRGSRPSAPPTAAPRCSGRPPSCRPIARSRAIACSRTGPRSPPPPAPASPSRSSRPIRATASRSPASIPSAPRPRVRPCRSRPWPRPRAARRKRSMRPISIWPWGRTRISWRSRKPRASRSSLWRSCSAPAAVRQAGRGSARSPRTPSITVLPCCRRSRPCAPPAAMSSSPSAGLRVRSRR